MELNKNNIEKLINYRCYFDEFILKLEEIVLSKNDKYLMNEFTNLTETKNFEEVYSFCRKLNLKNIDIDLEKHNIIKLVNVKLNLKDSFQLNNITFNIIKGEKVLIFGKNGSGKSSLLKLLSGKLPIFYNKESIMNIDNCDCYDEKNWLEINKKILFLSNLDTKWKSRVSENIKFSTLNDKNKIDKYKNFLEYEKYKDFKWYELSNGFKSRFLLSYGFIKKPKILLLDEPFSTLDESSLSLYLKEIEKEGQDITMIFSSQTLSNIEKIIDKVIFIYNNSIECFSKQELLNQDKHFYKIHFDNPISLKDKETIFCDIIEETHKWLVGESYFSKDEIFRYLIDNKISINYFRDLQFSFELVISKYVRNKLCSIQ